VGVRTRARVLNESGRFTEAPILANGEGGHAAAAVIGGEEPSSGAIQRDVARAGASRWNSIRKFKMSGLDGESADRAVLVFIRRVEVTLVGVDGQERGVGGLGCEAGAGQLTGCGIEVEGVNAFALGAGISADENGEIRGACGAREKKDGEQTNRQ